MLFDRLSLAWAMGMDTGVCEKTMFVRVLPLQVSGRNGNVEASVVLFFLELSRTE